MAQHIVLASGSVHRRMLLQNVGVQVEVEKSEIDERAIEETLRSSDVAPEDVAMVLAEAKAIDVSERRADALVIGCDQTLSLGDELFHKPSDMEKARRQLLRLSGRTHQLSSAVVLALDGEAIWRHTGIAHMTMRDLDPGFVGRYLSHAGEAALTSVGGYQIEGLGIQLFDKIDGDYFTIVGLPLLPLLAALRSRGAIDG